MSRMTKTKDIWPPLIEEARQGRNDSLFFALNQAMQELQHTLGRKITLEDWPPCVLAFVRESMAPTGRRGRRAHSPWYRYVVKTLYEQHRLLYAIGKKYADAVDEKGRPLLEQPATAALGTLSDMLNKSPEAVLDIVYPDRGKRGRKRRKNKPQC